MKWLWEHRTKLSGFLGVISGAVQMGLPQASVFLTVKQMAGSTMILGVITAAIGFFNSQVSKSDEPPP